MTTDYLAIASLTISRLASISAEMPGGTEYGSDMWCVDDIDPTGRVLATNDPMVVAQSIYHRLVCSRGSLVGDPDYGLGLSDWLERSFSQGEIAKLPDVIVNEVLKDDRIEDLQSRISYDTALQKLTVDLHAILKTGKEFAMIVRGDRQNELLSLIDVIED